MENCNKPYWQLFLDEGNEFPGWLKNNHGIKHSFKVPINKKKEGQKYIYENKKFLGSDDEFKYFLSEIAFNQVSNKDDKFFLIMVIDTEPKNPKKSKKFIKRFYLTFYILCPVIIEP